MRISQGSRTMTFDSFECAIDLHPNVRTAAAAVSAEGQHVLLRALRQKAKAFAGVCDRAA
jgi:hypothetical protein